MLLHQDAVGERDRDRAARAALADHARDGRHSEPRHDRLRVGDRAALPVLLRGNAGICAGRVDQAEHGIAVSLGSSITRMALRYPSGYAMPKFRFVRSLMSCRPF